MDRSTEIDLLEELAGLREAREFYLNDAVLVWNGSRANGRSCSVHCRRSSRTAASLRDRTAS